MLRPWCWVRHALGCPGAVSASPGVPRDLAVVGRVVCGVGRGIRGSIVDPAASNAMAALMPPSADHAAMTNCFVTVLVAVLVYSAFFRRTSYFAPKKAAAAPARGGDTLEASTSADVQWWHSPLASDSEARTIAAARTMVLQAGLAPLPEHVDLELLRQLRALGTRTTSEVLAEAYGKHLRWRRDNVLRPAAALQEGRALWYASGEHAYGDWAKSRVELGLCLGRATGGHPVKLERVGKARIGDVCAEEHGPEKLLAHYTSLLDTMLVALNNESVRAGRLLRMYEVFDLRGLSVFQCTVAAIRTITSLLARVTTVYAETTARAVLIGLPRAAAVPVKGILALLPARVACRVLVLSEGEAYDFASELDPDALRMLQANGQGLTAHVGIPFPGAEARAPRDDHWPGAPWPAEVATVGHTDGGARAAAGTAAGGGWLALLFGGDVEEDEDDDPSTIVSAERRSIWEARYLVSGEPLENRYG